MLNICLCISLQLEHDLNPISLREEIDFNRIINETHLTDDEEDNSHGSTGQSDQHEELEPENKTLKGHERNDLVMTHLKYLTVKFCLRAVTTEVMCV